MKLIFGSRDRIILSVIFALSFLFWLYLVVTYNYSASDLGFYTQFPLVIIPLLGGGLGLSRFKKWGGYQSVVGKVILFFSLALLIWGFAIGIWTYYLGIGTTLPYPSPADYLFIWSPFFWIVGLWQLGKVVGVLHGLKSWKGKLVSIVSTVIVAVVSYYVLVVLAHNDVLGAPDETGLQLFFDYTYTAGALAMVVLVAFIYSLSYKFLGGKYRAPVLLLFVGFITHFIAVCLFTKTVVNQTYFNGNIADLFFTIAVFLESLGLINLDTNLKSDGR